MGRVVKDWATKPGETPIDPSRLRPEFKRWVKTEGELAVVEADNVRAAHVKYLAGRLTAKQAPFDVAWMRRLHKEMFGKVWEWGGEIRKVNLQFGEDWKQAEMLLYQLAEDLKVWQEMD